MIVNLVVPSLEDAVKRDIVTDLPTPAGQTQRRSADWWLSQYEARKSTDELDAAAIAALVKKYRVSEKKGIGLVFIMERASSEEKQACFWPTWFDLAKKTVIETDRVCEKPSGTSFRNHWLGPVLKEAKNIVKALKKGDL